MVLNPPLISTLDQEKKGKINSTHHFISSSPPNPKQSNNQIQSNRSPFPFSHFPHSLPFLSFVLPSHPPTHSSLPPYCFLPSLISFSPPPPLPHCSYLSYIHFITNPFFLIFFFHSFIHLIVSTYLPTYLLSRRRMRRRRRRTMERRMGE